MFSAVREPRAPAYAAAWCSQQDFHTTGIAWNSGEGARQRIHRAKDEAEKAGLLVSLASAGRTSHVRLTKRGEHRAASLCGQFLAGDGLALFREIARIQGMPGRYFISENELLPLVPDADVDLIENMLLPLVIDGFLLNGIDTAGEIGYRIIADPPRAFNPPKADAGLFDESAASIFWDTFATERNRLNCRR